MEHKKENLSGRVELSILKRIWNTYPAKNKTESYKLAFLAALDCNTGEHTSPLGSGDFVTQKEDPTGEPVDIVDSLTDESIARLIKRLGHIPYQTNPNDTDSIEAMLGTCCPVELKEDPPADNTSEVDLIKKGMKTLQKNFNELFNTAVSRGEYTDTVASLNRKLSDLTKIVEDNLN